MSDRRDGARRAVASSRSGGSAREARVFCARLLVVDADVVHGGGGIVARRGRVERVLTTRGAVRRAAAELECTDLGDRALVPGLVNAHAHLELGGLAGRLDGGGSFARWIADVVALRRAESAVRVADAVRAGARRCLATGTTTVGDIDASGTSERVLARGPLSARVYREALDAGDPERTAGVLEALARPVSRARGRTTLRVGVSPHAPYTVSPGLWEGIARLARRKRLHASVHWAETDEELAWLSDGEGPFAELPLGRAPVGTRGLDAIERAGLLGPRTSLVHGNLATRAELERIARAGATLVHCAGTHAFFARGEPPLAAFLRAGCRVALGTDSLASNADLDLYRELALVRRSAPWLAPRDAFELATRGGAHALGLAGLVGALAPGARADACAVAWTAGPGAESGLWRRESALEALTTGAVRPEVAIVGGRAVVEEDEPE